MSRENCERCQHSKKEHGLVAERTTSPLNRFRPKYRSKLFKIRRLLCAHFPFKKCRNRQKETKRPAQDQQYEQVAKGLRGNRKRRPVGNEKAKKTIRKPGDAGGNSRRVLHDSPEMIQN